MKKILIVLNAIVYNRGSEALVRGISKICKENIKDSYITLVSSEEEFNSNLNIENIDNYVRKINYTKKSPIHYLVAILKRLKLNNLVTSLKYSKLKNIAKNQDLILMVGADNYDITYNMQEELERLNCYIRKNTKAKMILYDCSIAKRDITQTLKKDFENFDIVTVRENISKDNLKDIIKDSKLKLYPDPAFVMDVEKINLPEVFNKGNVIGINVSNLITNPKYGSNADQILLAYTKMIKYILENTDNNIMLVPHVMKGADLSTLKVLYNNFKENDRVYLVEDENLNAKQLKYLISNCRMFIGARTHATIAAYSTKVPTLVLGYSVKSRGIAKDLFGTDEKYVLPVSDLKSDDYLVNGFKWLAENEEKIKNTLEDKMPNYIEQIKSIKEIIK